MQKSIRIPKKGIKKPILKKNSGVQELQEDFVASLVQVWSPKLLKDGERDRQTGGDFIHKM